MADNTTAPQVLIVGPDEGKRITAKDSTVTVKIWHSVSGLFVTLYATTLIVHRSLWSSRRARIA